MEYPKEIEASRLRPASGVIDINAALEACYAGMSFRVRMVLLRDQLQERYGAKAVLFHTIGRNGKRVGQGKVRAEFRYS